MRKRTSGFCREGAAVAAVALACSSRNWPPRLPSLTHPWPRGSWGPKALSFHAPPGLHTSSPGNCSSGSGPAARSRGSVSPRSSPFSTSPGRSPAAAAPHSTPASLPAPPAALYTLRFHPYAGPRRPRPSDAASPHSGRVRSDNPRLASQARRPLGPHPSGPPLGRLVDASPTRAEVPRRRCLLPIGLWPCRSRLSSYFRFSPPFPVRRERSQARSVDGAFPVFIVWTLL